MVVTVCVNTVNERIMNQETQLNPQDFHVEKECIFLGYPCMTSGPSLATPIKIVRLCPWKQQKSRRT